MAELEKTPTFAPETVSDPESPLLRMAKEEKDALLLQIDLLKTEKEEKEREIESHKVKLHKLEYSKSEEIQKHLSQSSQKEKENTEKLEQDLLAMRAQLEDKEKELTRLKSRQSDAIYDFDRF